MIEKKIFKVPVLFFKKLVDGELRDARRPDIDKNIPHQYTVLEYTADDHALVLAYSYGKFTFDAFSEKGIEQAIQDLKTEHLEKKNSDCRNVEFKTGIIKESTKANEISKTLWDVGLEISEQAYMGRIAKMAIGMAVTTNSSDT